MSAAPNPHSLEHYAPPAGAMPIVFEDAHLLVIDKPAGLLSAPGRGVGMTDCVVSRLQKFYPEALLVHRLDMATSGLMIFARNPICQSLLSKQFAARQVHKLYQAWVHGHLLGEAVIDQPLNSDWLNRPKQKVDWEQGKPAQTRYRAITYDAARDITQVELEPITGRTHQLRVHLLSLGHPIVGDTLYGDAAPTDLPQRLYLHASDLSLLHPFTQLTLQFHCATPF